MLRALASATFGMQRGVSLAADTISKRSCGLKPGVGFRGLFRDEPSLAAELGGAAHCTRAGSDAAEGIKAGVVKDYPCIAD